MQIIKDVILITKDALKFSKNLIFEKTLSINKLECVNAKVEQANSSPAILKKILVEDI